VRLCVALPPQRKEVEVLGHQLLRSVSSMATHVREASRARSDAEFCSKLDGALQEANESQMWLELLRDDCAIATPGMWELLAEADELIGHFPMALDSCLHFRLQRKRKRQRKSDYPFSVFQRLSILAFSLELVLSSHRAKAGKQSRACLAA